MKYGTYLISGLLTLALCTSALAGRFEEIQCGASSDFFAADWHPSGKEALVVGDGVFRLDGTNYTLSQISNLGAFEGVAWRPQGDIALLVGESGLVCLYDGKTVKQVAGAPPLPLKDVAWSPDGTQAVIVGYGGAVVVYEKGVLTDHSVSGGNLLEGVTFSPDGSHALMVGIYAFSEETILRWDGKQVTKDWSGSAVTPGDIAYHPSGTYALIIEDWGHASTWDGKTFKPLVTGFEQKTDGLNCVDWAPDGSTALITGAWYHGPFPGLKTLVEFDGDRFNVLRMFEQTDDIFEGVTWKADASEALVVGKQGVMGRYLPGVKVTGGVATDQQQYQSFDTLTLSVDLINKGAPTPVDLYIDFDLNGKKYYWPTFSQTPFPIRGTLPAGLMIEDYPLWQAKLGRIPGYASVTWEIWIYEAGSMKLDDLYSYSSQFTNLAP